MFENLRAYISLLRVSSDRLLSLFFFFSWTLFIDCHFPPFSWYLDFIGQSWNLFLLCFFFKIYFIEVQLIYNIMSTSAIQQSESVTQYLYSFLKYSFPCGFITGYWIWFPGPYSRTLLFFHLKYNSLHLLIPTFHSIPLADSLPSGNYKSVLYNKSSFLFTAYVNHLRLP